MCDISVPIPSEFVQIISGTLRRLLHQHRNPLSISCILAIFVNMYNSIILYTTMVWYCHIEIYVYDQRTSDIMFAKMWYTFALRSEVWLILINYNIFMSYNYIGRFIVKFSPLFAPLPCYKYLLYHRVVNELQNALYKTLKNAV